MRNKLTYDAIHEKIVLGTCLKNDEILRSVCKRSDISFTVDRHKIIWELLKTIVDRKLEITFGTIESISDDKNSWGGRKYLDILLSKAEEKNIEFHIEKMKWDQTRLKLFERYLPRLSNGLKDPEGNIEDNYREAKKICDILDSSIDEEYKLSGKELSTKTIATINSRSIESNFRSSGYKAIDEHLIEGFADQRLSVITAASSIGKTSLMINLARKQMKDYKIGVLAWEGGIQGFLDGLCSCALGIPIKNLIKDTHLLTDKNKRNIKLYLDKILEEKRISFLKPPPKKLRTNAPPWEINNNILNWVEEQLERWDIDILYWDLFLKKLPARNPEQTSIALDRVQEFVEEGNTNSHICLLHQINLKKLEERKDKRPSPGILKGSGTWIETPDLVLGLHRPAIYEKNVADNTLEIICLKQRRGPRNWRIGMDWTPETTKISGGYELKPIVIREENNSNYGGRI